MSRPTRWFSVLPLLTSRERFWQDSSSDRMPTVKARIWRKSSATELDYDYTLPEWDWWHLPRDASTGVWTEPYFDEGGGNIYMTTFSAPFYREGRFTGVATIDIPLEPLKQLISSLQGEQGERFLLLSARQRILYSDNADTIGQPVLDVYPELDRPDIAAALEQASKSRDTQMLQLTGLGSTQYPMDQPDEDRIRGLGAAVDPG